MPGVGDRRKGSKTTQTNLLISQILQTEANHMHQARGWGSCLRPHSRGSTERGAGASRLLSVGHACPCGLQEGPGHTTPWEARVRASTEDVQSYIATREVSGPQRPWWKAKACCAPIHTTIPYDPTLPGRTQVPMFQMSKCRLRGHPACQERGSEVSLGRRPMLHQALWQRPGLYTIRQIHELVLQPLGA